MNTDKLRVLVVEDEIIIRRMIVNLIERSNATVVMETGSGNTAVDYLKNSPPVDLVCMDIHLESSMDGIETARTINSFSSVPILFISAYLESDRVQEGINFAGYLHKPISASDLHAVLKKFSTENPDS